MRRRMKAIPATQTSDVIAGSGTGAAAGLADMPMVWFIALGPQVEPLLLDT